MPANFSPLNRETLEALLMLDTDRLTEASGLPVHVRFTLSLTTDFELGPDAAELLLSNPSILQELMDTEDSLRFRLLALPTAQGRIAAIRWLLSQLLDPEEQQLAGAPWRAMPGGGDAEMVRAPSEACT